MAVKLKIRKGDKVVVRTGKDKGKSGEVLKVMPKESRVLVQGVNMVKRHTRPAAGNPGGIVDKEASIHISNVALADPKTGQADARRFQAARRRPQGAHGAALRRGDRSVGGGSWHGCKSTTKTSSARPS